MTYMGSHKKPGRSRVHDRSETSLEQGVTGQAVLLQDFPQTLERLNLNLPDAEEWDGVKDKLQHLER